jgi:peptidyl-dipeptidase Dcp
MIRACAFFAFLASCAHDRPPEAATPAAEVPAVLPSTNPFAQPSALPFHLPPFDHIGDGDFAAAFEAGMAEQRREMDAIAHDPAPPTFENTLVAMERSGALLDRVSSVFFNLNSSNTNDALQALEVELAPKLSAHADAILLDPALFARVDAVWKQRDTLGLDPESRQLLERHHTQFTRAGAGLSEADKTRLKQMNEELSTLQTAFDQANRNAMKHGGVVVDDVARLDGLSEEQKSAAAEAGKARGLDGKWVLSLQNTTIQPIIAGLKDRALREEVYRASSNRGQGGEDDTLAGIAKIAKLRAEQAVLLGYPTYAAYSLEDQSAKTPAAVNGILADLAPAALAKAKREAADIQARIDAEAKAAKKPSFQLQPWDWSYYAEQVRRDKYAFDESQVKPYFELDHVLRDGVFYAANELYGLTFTERTDLPVYHPDVRVFDVKGADGTPVGLFLLDWFARDSKQGGAWMSAFVDQSGLLGEKPVIATNLNIPKPAAGQPVLLTFDEVTTAFHEFGHALNGLLSDVKYPLLAGTNTPADFVEYPSQFNEMWAREPAVLAHYAKHYQTGAAMPKDLFDKILAAQTFDQGYATHEYLSAATIDQAWHQLAPAETPPAEKVMAFEAGVLQKAGLDFAPVPPRYHTPYFAHIWGGGYSASYYAYIWSEVLARDTGAWFHAHGGLARAPGDEYRAKVLSRGRVAEPDVLFQSINGAPPDVAPLLAYRGLADVAPAPAR